MGQAVALTVAPSEGLALPFGILTQTKKNRMVFWPVWPPGANMICAGERMEVFDHITLEFPSERIHMTAYDAAGRPLHVARAWGTHRLADANLAIWFILLVRVSTLRQQDTAVQRRAQTPGTDRERRTQEFVQYSQGLRFADVALPRCNGECDYIYAGVYLAPNSITPGRIPPLTLPESASMASQIDGWPDDPVFQVAVSRVIVGERTICIAAGCPPGRLRSDVSVGFPRRVRPQRTD